MEMKDHLSTPAAAPGTGPADGNSLALREKITRLKKELNAVILAHTYQEPEIQEIGDYVGDSLGLCIEASKTGADVIVFCGVHFMAESAKLLNPDKLVLIPDPN